jgi:probable HAF family extracellular repeat protein
MKRSVLFTLLALGLLGSRQIMEGSAYAVTTFDVPGSSFTDPFGINNVGQIVGVFSGGAFLYSNGIFSTIQVSGAQLSPSGINNTGQIVGSLHDNIGTANHGFLDNNGTITSFDVGDRTTGANSINDLGQIAGGYTSFSTFQHGFVGTIGAFNTLDVPGAIGAVALGINSAGQIVLGNSSAGSFLDTGGVFTAINVPGAMPLTTAATAINNLGQITGYFGDRTGGHIFVDTAGVFTTFDIPGNNPAISPQAFGINDRGQIVGRFSTDFGHSHGFLATPIPEPEPASILLLASGLAGIVVLIVRRPGTRTSTYLNGNHRRAVPQTEGCGQCYRLALADRD